MAASVTAKVVQTVPGAQRWTVTEVTFDSSYPTGGLAVTAAQLGLLTIDFAVATLKTAGTGSVTQVWYDVANAKLKAYVAAAEVTNATDISAVTAQVFAVGR